MAILDASINKGKLNVAIKPSIHEVHFKKGVFRTYESSSLKFGMFNICRLKKLFSYTNEYQEHLFSN